MADELELPEPIIQHIQSLLRRKLAARTSLVSKSWYSAWSTLPSLHLYQRDFLRRGPPNTFSNFARTALQRYRRSNRKLDTFTLSICFIHDHQVSTALVDEIITDALKLGVNCLNLTLHHTYALPVQVFLASSLTHISISDCLVMESPVLWSRLVSLTLSWVCFGDEAISAILSGCPLIECFEVIRCQGFTRVNLSNMLSLRKVSVNQTTGFGFRSQSPLVEFQDNSVDRSVARFLHLSSLVLSEVDVSNDFFHEFAVKFPCLEYLKLECCGGHENVQISSRSLKYLGLIGGKYSSVQLDVPNICQFIYSCTSIPVLSSSTDLKECECDISFECLNDLEALWFVELREFLQALKMSKISLHAVYNENRCVIPVEDTPGFSKPRVENLTVGYYSSSPLFSAFSSGLLWSCHPKVIVLNSAIQENQEALYKSLTEMVNHKSPITNDTQFYMPALEEVTVEFYEVALAEWQPIVWEDLMDVWNSSMQNRRIRFRLKWRDPI